MTAPAPGREYQIFAESVSETVAELFGVELLILFLAAPGGDTIVLPRNGMSTTDKMRTVAALMNAAERLAGEACGRPCVVRLEYGETPPTDVH